MSLISIRFDDMTLDRVKALAAKHKVGYQTMLKMLVNTQLEVAERGGVEVPPEMRKKRNTPTPDAEVPSERVPTVEVAQEVPPRPASPPAVVDEAELADIFSSL